MINSKEVEKIIKERIEMNPNDFRIMEKWAELTAIFIQDEKDTINYLNNSSKENLAWISEIFEDISAHFQSKSFIECIEQLDSRFPELNLQQDILYAKKAMK